MKTPSLLALAALAALSLAPVSARAEVVRPAPGFTWAAGKTLKSWKGQPVVLLIAPSPASSAFRKQARRIEAAYQEFAARNTIFVVAFTEADTTSIPFESRLHSNVPFVIANNGPQVAADYGFDGKFHIAIIGKDGNLDLTTAKVVPASRIRDMILNNFENQAAERKL